ncbi:hypothetical protein AXG93_4874s1340 [Marchantia polymorpha subsp. ruderalis]|uniref:Uncharacterized protein n=1 Tax=Marchantia polymorpha subsp. ruderalis TaxID=1480154 RepID=A0A176WFB0_MARPO|nr:hypothetical protein AXG93_4874s1340 [Marchantia polymorpha subsp. ruderalis]
MKTPRKRTAEVLAVSSDTEEDPAAMEEVVAKAFEDVGVAECGPQKGASPRTSTETVILETGEDLKRKRHSHKPLVPPVFYVCMYFRCSNTSTRSGRSMQEQPPPDLIWRLEACRTAYNAESLRVDELTIAAEKKEQEYDTELAAK